MTDYPVRTIALFLMLYTAPALAQPPGEPSSSARSSAATPGGVTRSTFVQRYERRLMAGDTDGDGKVSRAEILAAPSAGKADPAKRFARLDRNGDGMLDKAEIDAMLDRRFARLDANGDGTLSAEERAGARGKGDATGEDAGS